MKCFSHRDDSGIANGESAKEIWINFPSNITSQVFEIPGKSLLISLKHSIVVFAKMSRILTDHDMSLATNIRLAQCYVWSTLLYGCETWSLTQTNEMKLRGLEMWMYRRIGRVSWKAKKTNKEVLNKLGLQSTKLMTVVRQSIVRFYGHVRGHDSLQRIITEGMVNGKRGRGRKRCGWLGNVSRYAGMNINRCAEIATNREEWRTIVSNVVSDKEQR